MCLIIIVSIVNLCEYVTCIIIIIIMDDSIYNTICNFSIIYRHHCETGQSVLIKEVSRVCLDYRKIP